MAGKGKVLANNVLLNWRAYTKSCIAFALIMLTCIHSVTREVLLVSEAAMTSQATSVMRF